MGYIQMAEIKYIVVRDPKTDKESMVIFPDNLVHRHVASGIRRNFEQPVSGGFLRIGMFILDSNLDCQSSESLPTTPLAMCYGESESLKMRSRRREDSVLACLMLGLIQDESLLPSAYLAWINKE